MEQPEDPPVVEEVERDEKKVALKHRAAPLR